MKAMRVVKKILMFTLMVVGLSFAASAQTNDPNRPPKDPPKVEPKPKPTPKPTPKPGMAFVVAKVDETYV
ncbi:MAG TPA: hypothetical protein PKA82_10245 [Pyrinomonadaceae bacterium]|nr:hypothetical protein [Pyrinomonadaceae bacterium]